MLVRGAGASYSAIFRLSRNWYLDKRVAFKSTASISAETTIAKKASNNTTTRAPSQARKKDLTGQISSKISKYYSDAKQNNAQVQSKLSPMKLSKVRASQEHENLYEDRRQMFEKILLNSYLTVCVDVGQINRAYNTILKLTKMRRFIDVNHYNIILKGWAKLGSKAQVAETRLLMLRKDIEPNAESFAYILLSYAKLSADTDKNTIKKIHQEMIKKRIDPARIFHHAYLGPNERKSIIHLLKKVDPDYEDAFCFEPIEYDCKLLKDLYRTEYVPYDFIGLEDLSKLGHWADHQRRAEQKSSVIIKAVAGAKDSAEQIEMYSKLWSRLTEMWKKSLYSALDAMLESLQKQADEDPSRIHLYPFLCSVDKSMLVHLMLDEIENNASSTNYSLSTNDLHKNFGRKIMTRYLRAKSIEDGSHQERQKIYSEYLNEYCTDPDLSSRMNPRQFIQNKAAETKNYSIYKDKWTLVEEWSQNIVVSVGRLLYGIILRETKFDPDTVRNPKRDINMKNLVHAFYTAYFQIDSTYKIKEEFRARHDFERLLEKANSIRLKFDYSLLPCTSPPLPWLSRRFGGYLTCKSELVRVLNPFTEYVTAQTNENQKLYPSLDSLNAIGLCPWIVNQDILDLLIQLFQQGGDTELNVPLDEVKMSDKIPVLKENPSKADKILYYKDKKIYDQQRREMYSLWRGCLYSLSIANHFRDKTFWFPHNMDFRGRTYPIPPHFHHLGGDLARSLLLFAKGRPLGDKGLDWLKIHLINLVGKMKKNSMSERLEYANSILHLEVLDSADNPWDGRRWWTKNEDPWQVLACCKEIAKAIRSRDYRQYISHFPVHQDGSCNGLQHYAALGRDPGGAMAVNLIPNDRPQDVYAHVVDIVESMRVQDAAKGVKVAIMLDGFIQRKVIKQTVMTTVYGVTRYGARRQIAGQLLAKGYSEREVWQAATYLTAKTFDSIGQMFGKSRVIQDWLTGCAYIIASKCRKPVSWETPLGLSVIQPYALPRSALMSHALYSNLVVAVTSFNDPISRLNTSKQKNAFPPNYIHSLDSSHMMLTSLHCQRRGVTFVSVHDCYWTHPSTVDEMNRMCREQFIVLHSEPLLRDLSEQFIKRFGKCIDERAAVKASPAASVKQLNPKALPRPSGSVEATMSLIETYDNARQIEQDRALAKFLDVPVPGELDLAHVLNSTYFFS